MHHAKPGMVIAEKSTVPAGTADRVVRAVAMQRPDLAASVEVVSNPAVLREGHALAGCDASGTHPRRGRDKSPRSPECVRSTSRSRPRGSRLVETDIRTAELAKHACNAFLALKISFANALARMCEGAGADVVSVTEMMGSDPRIGPGVPERRSGLRRVCFPKDLVAFERLAGTFGYDFGMLERWRASTTGRLDADRRQDQRCPVEPRRKAPGSWGSRSSRAPTTCGSAGDHARRALVGAGGSVVGHDPQAADERRARPVTGLDIVAGRTRRLRVPTASCSAPSGRNSRTWTW